MEKLLIELKERVPEFYEYEMFDNLLTVDFDRLGTYLCKLLKIQSLEGNKKVTLVIEKIFNFLNDVFVRDNGENQNLIKVCIFEPLVTIKEGYEFAKKYMNNEMYSSFLAKFPYSRHKDDWDSSKYYTEAEFKSILKKIEEDL